MTVGYAEIREHVHFEGANFPLHHLAQTVRGEDPWNLDPDYQRGHVWTLRQQQQFMGHFLENGRMPLVFLQEYTAARPYEVLDGKQRLTACLNFLDGAIPAEVSDGRCIWWADFDPAERRMTPWVAVGIVRLPTRAEVLRFYIKLNRGGTVHTDAEIDRVRALLSTEVNGNAR